MSLSLDAGADGFAGEAVARDAVALSTPRPDWDPDDEDTRARFFLLVFHEVAHLHQGLEARGGYLDDPPDWDDEPVWLVEGYAEALARRALRRAYAQPDTQDADAARAADECVEDLDAMPRSGKLLGAPVHPDPADSPDPHPASYSCGALVAYALERAVEGGPSSLWPELWAAAVASDDDTTGAILRAARARGAGAELTIAVRELLVGDGEPYARVRSVWDAAGFASP